MGLRASSLGELIFENCFVPEERLLGAEGQGLEVALSQLDAGRISIGVVGVGITEEILRRGWPSLHEEGDKQSVSGYFARWQAIKSLVEKASALKDKGQKISTFASQIKLLGTDLAMEVTSYMSLLLGAEGVKVENEFERYFRDAKALQIVEGTNQVQQRVLAKALDELYV